MPLGWPSNSGFHQVASSNMYSQHAKPSIESKCAVQNYVKMAPSKLVNKKSIKSKNIIKKVKNTPSNIIQSSISSHGNTKMIISPNQISK